MHTDPVRQPRAMRPGQGGFTLVEALVALLAISIGLLGIAGLQLAGLRANQSSSWRSQAIYLSYDILDRMRANRTDLANYEVPLGAVAACVAGSSVRVCDLSSWKANVQATLPAGDGTVTVDGADNTVITVTIQWTDDRDGSGDPLVFTMQSRI